MEDFKLPGYNWSNRELIGKGGFGSVYRVKNTKTNQFIAVKQMDMKNFDEDYKIKALENQINITKELSSPYTVQMYETFKTPNYTYILLQLCESDLRRELDRNDGTLPEKKCSQIFGQIMKGFKVLIDHKYIHRDVKPENILIRGNSYKLADFGFSRKINEEKLVESCGTRLYMAPQLVYNKEYTNKCDLWSLGLMLFQMLYGYGPWPTRHFEVYSQNIIMRPVAFPYGTNIGENTKDFIMSCLQVQENRRITWQQAFKHPFVNGKLGAKIKQVTVDQQLISIFFRVQQSSIRKCVNVLQQFKKFGEHAQLKLQQFQKFMVRLDPTITTYQVRKIFEASDLTKDGLVDVNEFYQIFCDVDYRPDDVAIRNIQQIISMAQARRLNIRQFFDMFDKNKSGDIDFNEFGDFIQNIAPNIQPKFIKLMWDRFDHDKSGQISKKQFVAQMTRGVPTMSSSLDPGLNTRRERARRNLQCLKSHLHRNKIIFKKVIQTANQGNELTLNQFGPMVSSINGVITKEEIVDMFRLLDQNNDGKIKVDRFRKWLNY